MCYGGSSNSTATSLFGKEFCCPISVEMSSSHWLGTYLRVTQRPHPTLEFLFILLVFFPCKEESRKERKKMLQRTWTHAEAAAASSILCYLTSLHISYSNTSTILFAQNQTTFFFQLLKRKDKLGVWQKLVGGRKKASFIPLMMLSHDQELAW